MRELTGLLRDMACACKGVVAEYWLEGGQVVTKPPSGCARCQALALAEEQERQLAAAHARVEALESMVRRMMPKVADAAHEYFSDVAGNEDSRSATLFAARDLLRSGSTAALDAHDERVWREALESAADAIENAEQPLMAEVETATWLRKRAKRATP